MSERSALAWLREARLYAFEAAEIARSLDMETVDGNRQDIFAIRYCLAIVGEALNAVPRDVQALSSEIRWRAIYNLRNRLIHGFWLIDNRLILHIARNDAEKLVASIERLMEEIA